MKKLGKRSSFKLEKIQDKESQRVSLCKRKRGIIKKCIELSVMHSQDVFILIFDKNQQRLVEYRSDPQMNVEVAKELLERKLQFTCQHYDNESL